MAARRWGGRFGLEFCDGDVYRGGNPRRLVVAYDEGSDEAYEDMRLGVVVAASVVLAGCRGCPPAPSEGAELSNLAGQLKYFICLPFFPTVGAGGVEVLHMDYHECLSPWPEQPGYREAACTEDVYPPLESSVELATQAGLEYSRDCHERSLNQAYDGPPKESTGTWLDCEDDCQYLFGEQPEGAACESFGHRMSDCEQDLVCAPDRTCHLPCTYSFISPAGGFCGPVSRVGCTDHGQLGRSDRAIARCNFVIASVDSSEPSSAEVIHGMVSGIRPPSRAGFGTSCR